MHYFRHDARCAFYAGKNFVHRLTSLLCQAIPQIDFGYAGSNQRFDFFGRTRTALSQTPDLGRNHSKPTSLFTRSGSFNGGIQCQNIRLKCNPVDDADNGFYLARTVVDIAHGVHDFRNYRSTCSGNLSGADDHRIRLNGTVAAMFDSRSNFFHGGGGLLQTGGLRFSPCG